MRTPDAEGVIENIVGLVLGLALLAYLAYALLHPEKF
ncbi:K(+)-transporting ATPase subunit F [Nostocoides japonicum]|nr:K(+)-transporting ATPase subunit F [Tetrasphaera japonica]